MRVLLIASNRHDQLNSRMNAQPLPIGLAYVASYLDHDRHQVRVLDLMFSEDYLGDVESTLTEFQPEAVGISLRNLSNHSYLNTKWELPITKEVIEKIREVSDATVICGGPAFSILPKECFNYLSPDLGVAGDGGETFAELNNCLEDGQPGIHSLPGLVYRIDGQTVMNENFCTSDFTKRPLLENLDMTKYQRAGFGIGVLTKLGSFHYPSSADRAQIYEAGWRVIRPIDEVVAEVKEMKDRYDLRKVFFIDNGFNLPLEHAKSLCNALIEANLKLIWNTCLAPFDCDAELVRMMKQAGCALVMLTNTGSDSHDTGDLNEDLRQLQEVTKLCEEGMLRYIVSRTFGEPGDTLETVDQKLQFLRSIRPAMANLRVGVSVIPGTPLASTALKEGLIADESDLIRPTFYVAEDVRDWIVDYLREDVALNPRWNLW